MISTLILESATKKYKPSIHACMGGLSFSAQENAAISLPVMLDGSIRPQMLPFGTMTIQVQGSGDIAPHFDDVPLGELLTLHSGTQRSIELPAGIAVAFFDELDGNFAPAGYRYARVSISNFDSVLPCRSEEHYEPVFCALFEQNGNPEIYRGDHYRRGDFVYAVVPMVYDTLKVNYFPKYQGYLVQPVQVTTDGLAATSWSFDFVTNIQRGAGA